MTGPAVHFVQKADVVFGIGSSFTRHPMAANVWDGKRLIHATNDTRDMHKDWPAEHTMLGDAKLVLRQLIEAYKALGRGPNGRAGVKEEVARVKGDWLAEWMPKLTSEERPMTPYRVIWEFMRTIDPKDAIVTHDSGSPRDQIMPFYEATTPNGYIGWGKSHALGTGLGLTIGAKLAAPDKFCVNFMGDAAFGMTGLDFETAARCGIPICTIVLNNSTMAIETQHLAYSHEHYRTRDINGNYADMARSMGGYAERVEDPGEIGAAILRARKATENGQAALLEFITSAETAFSHRQRALRMAAH
jgi:acetolactate synthase-1/2/3 large subunit